MRDIEALELVNPEIAMSDAQVTVELSSSTLKKVYVESISLDKFILEADGLETLHLKDCALEFFELVGKGHIQQLHNYMAKVLPDDFEIIKSNGVVSEEKSHEECQMLASFTTAGVGHDEEIHFKYE
ncbi:hypothetical protein LR48_Vigan08g194200 [Vigna angularis]|uniref:Uncharacterized protein n=1 Tax=Phaseolus angularis TaxID=3914 RepID=A0A0L9V7R7_PHAAN|nr:hypothetical protein LR48_Vigan08g194200 [Vigna angularis]